MADRRQALRDVIAAKPEPGSVVKVTRRWLEDVANDLDELAALRAGRKGRK